MRLVFAFFCIICFLQPSIGWNQKGVTTFGIQYKPVIPNRIIGTYEVEFNSGIFRSSMKQKLGNSYGMVVRQGLTDLISFETGLVFTQRNFGLNFEVEDSNYFETGKVRFVGYEIPFKGLIFIRLGEQLFMNTGLGASFNYFPSDVQVQIPVGLNEYFSNEGARLNRIQGALLADIGFEFRTRKSGYFYLGASYNLPFAPIVTFAMAYEFPPNDIVIRENVRGSYLTVDFRYYFHEKPRSDLNRR